MIRVTVWNENWHEKKDEKVIRIYPNGIHGAIAEGIRSEELSIRTATQDQEEHGLTEEVLDNTDVLIWWGHMRHHLVSDEIVERVRKRVWKGMGLIVLHSGHFSKVFKSLMGTSCDLRWRENDEKERIWVVDPAHPIAEGLGSYFELEREETYGEHFDIPAPDELVFVSWFEGGDVFRSGCTYHRGQGKIFYFRPGHEEFPTYYNKDVLRVISNAVHWAAAGRGATPKYGKSQALEAVSAKIS
ncbi:ThuA domain-containing protein [Paenibacillus koleovorans]|uniref:ThuA domain-containing protein n=1 Tax=Paenibacillus koleovorans TaxID=121608 RepID=UPI000FDC0BCE|nr:ThuA domain-containing protein [Paenibacillus koleovorans]